MATPLKVSYRLDQKIRESIKNFIARAVEVPFLDEGRDFSGWDCAGLILAAYRECRGLDLPDLAEISALDAAAAGAFFAAQAQIWREIDLGREQPLDVALLRRGRWPCHVGLVVSPGYLLHVQPESGTCIEPLFKGLLRTRLVGIYRHEQLCALAPLRENLSHAKAQRRKEGTL